MVMQAPCHVESAFDRIQLKLKKIKQYCKGSGFHTKGERRKRKQQIQAELYSLQMEEENTILSYSQQVRSELKYNLMHIL